MASVERYSKSEKMHARAMKIIPLASQTFSKSITQFPFGVSPLFIKKGKGSRVWDVDGNEYIDFMNALLSVTLGYNYEIVTNAVKLQIENGVSFSLPHELEIEVAELLVELIPCAEKVRFGKNGSDVTAAAIRLARAYTGKEHVIVCGYHGWQDWYIGSTSMSMGVPDCVRELTHVFNYNDIDSLLHIFEEQADKIAAVIMEPMNSSWPDNGFLENVKTTCHKNDALLIFDEMITGCRLAKGGAQELFGVTPDLATFGKGIANGFPLSAIVGRSEIMNMMDKIFFSGTFGGETASLAAAKEVLKIVRDGDVIDHIYNQGLKVFDEVSNLIKKNKADTYLEIVGHPSWSILLIKDISIYSSWEIKTLYLQEMFKRGIITIGSHNISYSHDDDDINELINVYAEVLPILSDAITKRTLHEKLEAKVIEPLFKVR